MELFLSLCLQPVCFINKVSLLLYKHELYIIVYYCKSLIEKPGLDQELFTNYSPVSSHSFVSIRILGHILDNNIVASFQSAYEAGNHVRRLYFVCTMIFS